VIEFVFMLTHNDATVADARAVVDEVDGTGLRYIGFKDVGASVETLRDVTAAAHHAGLEVMLEIVTTNADDEARSLRNAHDIGVDWVLGGTHPDLGADALRGSGILYCPFPGIVTGHPSVLGGDLEHVAQHARALTAAPGVHGVDLLAYRHHSVDPLALTRAVVDAADGPVIVAGSIATLEQVEQLERAGAWGFTVGGAVFEHRFPGGESVRAQVETILRAADATPA
jgi:DhnA family fructose-bisphosphate aldolase class Ia